MNSKRLESIDVLKGLAIICVVLAHCIQVGSGYEYWKSEQYYNNALYKIIYMFHMPLFMFLSGYLSVSVAILNKKSIYRCIKYIIPIISIASIKVFVLFTVKHLPLKNSLIIYPHTLWFLWSLIINIVILNVYSLFSEVKQKVIFFIILCIIIFFTPDILGASMYKFMFPFFFSGYFMKKNQVKVNYKTVVFTLFLMAFFCIYIVYDYNFFIYNSGITLLNKKNIFVQLSIDLIRYVAGGIGIYLCFCLYKVFFSKFKIIKNFLKLFGTNTLGIYIFSTEFLNLLIKKFTYGFKGCSPVFVLIETVFILIFSLIIIHLVKLVKPLKFLFLGEIK